MRPQQQIGSEVEGVPVLARRVARWDVEGLEVVPLGLDLRPELDLVAQGFEHGLDLALHLREDVDVSATQRRAWERDVDRLRFGDVGQPRVLEFDALRLRQLAYARQEHADAAVLAAEVVHLDRRELGLGPCLRDRRDGLLHELLWVGHPAFLRRTSNRSSAAAAATFSDSTPAASGTVTVFKSPRDRPCASLPSTIMPAFSIGALERGSPPEAAAP